MDAHRFLINTIFIRHVQQYLLQYHKLYIPRKNTAPCLVYNIMTCTGHGFLCVWCVFNTYLNNISPLSRSRFQTRCRNADGRGRLGVRLIKVYLNIYSLRLFSFDNFKFRLYSAGLYNYFWFAGFELNFEDIYITSRGWEGWWKLHSLLAFARSVEKDDNWCFFCPRDNPSAFSFI